MSDKVNPRPRRERRIVDDRFDQYLRRQSQSRASMVLHSARD
jgi:hypothetical protein